VDQVLNALEDRTTFGLCNIIPNISIFDDNANLALSPSFSSRLPGNNNHTSTTNGGQWSQWNPNSIRCRQRLCHWGEYMSSKHDIQPMGNVNCIFRDLKIDFRGDFSPSEYKKDVYSGQTMFL